MYGAPRRLFVRGKRLMVHARQQEEKKMARASLRLPIRYELSEVIRLIASTLRGGGC